MRYTQSLRLFVIPTLALLFAALYPFSAFAETVFRYGTDINISTDQTIDGDLYAFSGQWWAPGKVNISGVVDEDIYAFGQGITINGSVGADAALIGFDVQIHGPVEDDLRVLGDKVLVADDVKGDLFVVAENLTVLSSASVAGNIYFYGTKAEISGDVRGSVHGAAESWRIDSYVGGNIGVNASKELVLGARANVTGDVTYTSTNEIVRSAQSVVEGEIAKNDDTFVTEGRSVVNSFIPAFTLIFASFFLFLFFRNEHRDFINEINSHKARNFIIGLVSLIVLPVVSILLILTVLGSVLGVGLLSVYVLLLVLSAVSISLVLGTVARKLYSGRVIVDFSTILIGALLFLILAAIPFFGSLILFTVFSISLGAMIYKLYEKIR